jgi:hypothetical protein
MKHIKPMTQQPQAAQTTLLQVKLEFVATVVPTAVQIWFDKNGGSVPL